MLNLVGFASTCSHSLVLIIPQVVFGWCFVLFTYKFVGGPTGPRLGFLVDLQLCETVQRVFWLHTIVDFFFATHVHVQCLSKVSLLTFSKCTHVIELGFLC